MTALRATPTSAASAPRSARTSSSRPGNDRTRWTAGYLLHLEADGSDTLATTNRNTANGTGLFTGRTNFVQTLQSYWFVKSETYGKVGVGLQSMPSDNAAILVDGSGSLVPANWVTFDVGGFNFRTSANTPGKQIIAGCNGGGDCYGVPANGVRYDTPDLRWLLGFGWLG